MARQMTRKGLVKGVVFGGAILALVLLGTLVKGLSAGTWEVLEWTGLMLMIASFPVSLLLGFAAGWLGLAILAVAVLANWALVGGVVGLVLDLVIGEPAD